MGELKTSKYGIDDLLKEADEAVSNPNWTIATSKTPGLYKEALIPGAIAFFALRALGPLALEALALGPLALEALALGPLPAAIAAGYGIKTLYKRKKQQQAKELALKQLIARQNAIVKALQNESKEDKERIESLTKLNKILQETILQLKKTIPVS